MSFEIKNKNVLITGATSGVKARVVGYSVADSTDPDTLFIKYIATGTDNAAQIFSDSENISADVDVYTKTITQIT